MKITYSKCALIGVLMGLMIAAPACTFQQGLQEVEKTLAIAGPFIDLIPAFVCPIDATACTTVQGLASTASAVDSVGTTLVNNWINALPATQPSILGNAIAGIQAEQKSQEALIAAAHVTNQASQAKISGIASSLSDATLSLLTLLQQAQAGGGTTQALAELIMNSTPEYDDVFPATLLFPNPVHLFVKADTIKLKSGMKIHTSSYHKNRVLDVLKKKSGDPIIDAIAQAKYKALKSL